MQTHVVIMAGGIGSRFWPMSSPKYPKQFIDILGTGRTLIQMTVDRFAPLCPPENIWVVTGERYLPLVKAQLPQIPEGNIVAEPVARNTAPCIALACRRIQAVCPDANIVVTPSDALVLDVPEYRRIIGAALDFTAASNAIVTIGIKPTRAETGYGYIEIPKTGIDGVVKVESFREKPNLYTAKEYLSAGNYLWNAGIFVWKAETINAALAQYAPQIAGVMSQIQERGFSDEAVRTLFPACEKISIDYAVMEKSPDIYTIPAEFGWSDLGTWGSLLQNSSRDADGNAATGAEVRMFGCRGNIVHVSTLNEVVLEGLENYIVAESEGKLIICRLSEEQRIKDFHD